jgi:beta-lactamase regulating signal transducer with metallopeptidase domain
MNNTILTILSLSASGSVIALILLALRPFLKNKVSKTFQYYIWLLVLVRLALPLSFNGSIMNQIMSRTVIAQAPVVSATDESGRGMLMQGEIAPQGDEQNTSRETAPSGTALNGNAKPDPGLPAAPETTRFNIWKFVLDHLTAIWLLGAALHFGWFIIAYLRFSRKIRKTGVRPHSKDMEVFIKLRGNTRVRLSCNPYINTPMLIGFLSPCIVIPHLAFTPNGMKPELIHILRHELTHYRRRDLLYKWVAVLVSSLHWFNPLMILVRREISRACELSCDEALIRSLDAYGRQDYGETLLAIASKKRFPTGIVTTTMCEGKRELKERLESIMTYKSKSVLMVALSLVLTLVLAGCSMALGAANVNNQMPDDEASQTPVTTDAPSASTIPDDEASQSPAATDASSVSASPSAASSDSKSENTKTPISSDNPVLEAYNAVLQDKAEFVSTDSKKNLYLNDFLTNKEIYETVFNITHFTVLDMDGDKVPEVVLELSVGGNPQFYEVLHYMNDTIYGYLITYRGLTGLKADGTFGFSSGAADNGVGKLKFESDAFKTDKLGYSQSSQGDTDLTISYFINNEPVTKESYDSFQNEQSGKKDAVWYEFSQKNIETELSANP